MSNIIKMFYKERQEILDFHPDKIVPASVTNKVLRTAFERRAKKFAVDPRTKFLKYKRSDSISCVSLLWKKLSIEIGILILCMMKQDILGKILYMILLEEKPMV